MIKKLKDGSVEITFGDGDVKIQTGHDINGDRIMCFFKLDKSFPVGTQFPEDIGKISTNDWDAMLRFKSRRDIFNLIQQLCIIAMDEPNVANYPCVIESSKNDIVTVVNGIDSQESDIKKVESE